MNTFQQLIVIALALFIIYKLMTYFNQISILQKNNPTQEEETKPTIQALDILPIPSTILTSKNPNVIETNEVKTF